LGSYLLVDINLSVIDPIVEPKDKNISTSLYKSQQFIEEEDKNVKASGNFFTTKYVVYLKSACLVT